MAGCQLSSGRSYCADFLRLPSTLSEIPSCLPQPWGEVILAMDNSGKFTYRRDIDGLRSLAVLFVLVFHFELVALGEGGFQGVDIFFVISGFLITSIILKQLQRGTFDFRGFYIKRVRRLAPALMVVLILTMIAGGILLLPSDYIALAKQFAATQFYYSNFFFWQNVNYFQLQADATPLLHTWSLAVEEQFYLLFPVSLFVIHRYCKNYFWHIMTAGTVISFALNIALVASKPELSFYLMPTRGWELLAGGLVVWIIRKPIFESKMLCEVLGLAGLGLIIYAVLAYHEEVQYPGHYALLPVVGSMLVIISGQQDVLTCKLFKLRLPVYIGHLSYSLYLVHWPIHVFASQILKEQYTIGWKFGMFGLTFAVSMLLFHLIEDPIRKGQLFGNDDRQLTYYFSGLGLSLGVFLLIFFTDGLPARFSARTIDLASYVSDTAPHLPECNYKDKASYSAEDFCKIGAANRAPQWVVVGDSHARALRPAFDAWLKERGESGLFMYRHSCVPLMGVDQFRSKGACLRFTNNVYKYLLAQQSLENIVLISTWLQIPEGGLTHDSYTKLSPAESLALFQKQFPATMKSLKSAGKKAFVWAPVPTAKGNVPKELAMADDFERAQRDLEYTREEYRERFGFFFAETRTSSSAIHRVLSAEPVLCGGGRCLVYAQGRPLYSDTSHMTYSSTTYWVNILKQQYDSL